MNTVKQDCLGIRFAARSVSMLLALLLHLCWPAIGVHARNIFDDDWTPPPPREPAHPLPEVIATKPAVPPEAGTQSKTPATVPATPVAVVAPPRRPIPSKADQAKSRKLFKEVFANDLADRSVAARRSLATKLVKTAADTADVPSDYFVLLIGAMEAGKESADLSVCITAADTLAASYEIDSLRLKSDTALKMSLRAESPSASAINCKAGLELIDQLVADADYATAARVMSSLRGATADAALTLQLQNRTRDLDVQRAAAGRISVKLEKLKASPTDPALNLAVGQFLCFVKGDWLRGLPMLSIGSDATLQALALKDLAGAQYTEQQVELGDGWWDLAQKNTGIAKSHILAHAGKWYGKAAPKLSGLSKAQVEMRLKKVAAFIATSGVSLPPLNLLSTMKGTRAAVIANGTVVLSRGGKIATPDVFQPPVTFQLTVMTDEKDFRLGYAADEIIFNWEYNHDELRVGGGPASGQHKGGAGRLPMGQWVDIEFTVNLDEMIISIDGVERYKVKADFSKIDESLKLTAVNGDVKIKSVGRVQSPAK